MLVGRGGGITSKNIELSNRGPRPVLFASLEWQCLDGICGQNSKMSFLLRQACLENAQDGRKVVAGFWIPLLFACSNCFLLGARFKRPPGHKLVISRRQVIEIARFPSGVWPAQMSHLVSDGKAARGFNNKIQRYTVEGFLRQGGRCRGDCQKGKRGIVNVIVYCYT